jgi:hypothetical protein
MVKTFLCSTKNLFYDFKVFYQSLDFTVRQLTSLKFGLIYIAVGAYNLPGESCIPLQHLSDFHVNGRTPLVKYVSVCSQLFEFYYSLIWVFIIFLLIGIPTEKY